MTGLLDFFLHLDTHLQGLAHHYGALTYLILFAILFTETGFVITPFLPGDSLLFLTGALAATPNGGFNPWILFVVFVVAAVVGDSVNFEIGKRLGRRLPFLSEDKVKKTEDFFHKHGGKTIVIARFIPVIRTFAPFVAGMGSMHYGNFIRYNIVGALLWVSLLFGLGYFFGNLPFIHGHFSLVLVAIIVLSVIPAVYEWFAARGEKADDDKGPRGEAVKSA